MLRLYTSPSCASCRKVKKYFNSHKIPYVEKNIINTPLTREDIFRIVTKSENGFEDIISSRSKIFKEKNQFITTTPFASNANCSFGLVIAAISASDFPPSFA